MKKYYKEYALPKLFAYKKELIYNIRDIMLYSRCPILHLSGTIVKKLLHTRVLFL